MPRNVPSRTIRLIILPIFIIGGVLGGYALMKVDQRLGPLEMFMLIAGLILASIMLEVLAVWGRSVRGEGDTGT